MFDFASLRKVKAPAGLQIIVAQRGHIELYNRALQQTFRIDELAETTGSAHHFKITAVSETTKQHAVIAHMATVEDALFFLGYGRRR